MPIPRQIQFGEITIDVVHKDIKNLHMSVHPPTGRVTIAAPLRMKPDAVRVFALSKLAWIKRHRRHIQQQARETPREFIERESHYLWGRRHLLTIIERDARPSVSLDHKRITLAVRPGSDQTKRKKVVHAWHKSLLHAVVPALIAKWEPRLGVKVTGYFLQRMKTKWGSCNHRSGHIRLNTELIKKPKDLLEYVVIHEMVHLLEPTHNDRFAGILGLHYPNWREARSELNALPLTAETWKHY